MTPESGRHATVIKGFSLTRWNDAGRTDTCFHKPAIGVVLQGQKESVNVWRNSVKTPALYCKVAAALLLACSFLMAPGIARAASPAEQQRIELLLAAIGEQHDLVFIRNGSEHTAAEAVSHLQRKLRRAGNRISTAEEFIDHLATASSFSGKPYMIRQPGKEPEPAGPFLHRLLREVARD